MPPHLEPVAQPNGRQEFAVASGGFGGAWLGAGAMHTQDNMLPQMVYSLVSLCRAYPQLEVVLNHFDDEVPRRLQRQATVPQPLNAEMPRIKTTRVPGMKTLFWRVVLTPEFVSRFSLVFTFDGDIALHPSVFPLGAIAAASVSIGASLVQPSIRAVVHGTHHLHLRVKPAHMSCLAHSARFVELQLSLFRTAAWAEIHRSLLSHIAAEHLATSDYGIDQTWCALLYDAFPRRPACVVLPTESVLHTNTHRIEKFMNRTTQRAERSCSGTCATLRSRFARYFQNESHDHHLCWEATSMGLRLRRNARFGIGRGMVMARALPAAAAASEAAAAEATEREPLHAVDGDPATVPKVVGACSMHGRDRGLPALLASLRSLCDAHPHLRVLLNYHEGGERPLEQNDDPRIVVSTVGGDSPLAFWRRELTPQRLEWIDAVWIFDARLGVHDAVLPLGALIHARYHTRAAVLIAPTVVVGGGAASASASAADAAANAAAAAAAESAATGAAIFEGAPPGCAATTIAEPPSFDSLVISGDAWAVLHKHLLRRATDSGGGQLTVADPQDRAWWQRWGPGLPLSPEATRRAICAVVASRSAREPACVIAREPALRLFGGSGSLGISQGHGRRGRGKPAWASALRETARAFAHNRSAAPHDDGRCWALGADGWRAQGFRTPALGERFRLHLSEKAPKMKQGLPENHYGRDSRTGAGR